MTSALLLSIVGLSVGVPHCPMWKEIAPCTCRMGTQMITIQCDQMDSFQQVVDLLKGHFTPADKVSLKISFSRLDDLPLRSFSELNMTIENLKLNHNNLGDLYDGTFEGLNKVVVFSLADNYLVRVPDHIWPKVASVKTVDIGRTKIHSLSNRNFKDLTEVQCLVVAGNVIANMDQDTFPPHIQRLHIGRNSIRNLNKTLSRLNELVWLFANSNELTDIEGELPVGAPHLQMIHFSQNQIRRLPTELRTLPVLESLFFQYNQIRSFDGILNRAKKLKRLVMDYNEIDKLTPQDFLDNDALESLTLGNNRITTLNNSLVNLHNINYVNLSNNLLTEFSFHELMGLHKLTSIDLSFNRIKTIVGPVSNLVEWTSKLTVLKLDHNQLESLNGAISGFPDLLRLNLSFNLLTKFSSDDLMGLDQLRLLDVSHNYLTVFDPTSKVYLPRLEELRASHNLFTILERDFDGFPALCHADLSSNHIIAMSRELFSKTRCKVGHGTPDGSWDVLKLYLQDNPILCDSALPEISSTLEINHARIHGVAHCVPLSEQPVTSKPTPFLGYIPVDAPASGGSALTNIKLSATQESEPAAQLKVTERLTDESSVAVAAAATEMLVAMKQEQKFNKLASEIEELRNRVDVLASQNQYLLNHQLSLEKIAVPEPINVSTPQTVSPVVKLPNDIVRKP